MPTELIPIDLDPSEQALIAVLRKLQEQDVTFNCLCDALTRRLEIMLERGKRYNVNGVTLHDHNFDRGDVTASVKFFDPVSRLRALVADNRERYSNCEIADLLDDIGNYVDIWRCCRARREQEVLIARK